MKDRVTKRRHKGPARDTQRRRRAAQAACERLGISDGARVTYVLALTKYSSDGAKKVFPSQRRLAEDRGVSERTIVRHVKELKDADLWIVDQGPIVREANGTVHRARTNRYLFCVPKGQPKRKKPSSHRHDTGVTQNHITTLCGNTSFRVPRVFDPNCSLCEGTGWAETPDLNQVQRCNCKKPEMLKTDMSDLSPKAVL